ncbi:hypothetical protein U472_13205 [Orenia metallireducens]|jgi:DnaJ-class molecular chaperone|uniref:J domain-containing protein n=1 Tax=Orenia metallireducens TaxID=1413210 RepID=A0A1C0A5B7_9FIRM|nr:DnaJ domain-containing protein [Orenia metallireducens]OCL25309.1 hypothetical protein U472_13205 [Orenia metallireducens]
MKNYYEILGVNSDADSSTIKRAYRKLALKYHPDRNSNDKNAEKKFKLIAKAYEVLKSKKSRAKYDASLKRKTYQRKATTKQNSNRQSAVPNFGNFEKQFEQFFGFNPKTKERVKNKTEEENPMNTDELFRSYFGMK